MIDWKFVSQLATLVILYIGGIIVIAKIIMGLFKETVKELINHLRDETRREHDRLEAKVDNLARELTEVKAKLDKTHKFVERHNAITSRTHTR